MLFLFEHDCIQFTEYTATVPLLCIYMNSMQGLSIILQLNIRATYNYLPPAGNGFPSSSQSRDR